MLLLSLPTELLEMVVADYIMDSEYCNTPKAHKRAVINLSCVSSAFRTICRRELMRSLVVYKKTTPDFMDWLVALSPTEKSYIKSLRVDPRTEQSIIEPLLQDASCIPSLTELRRLVLGMACYVDLYICLPFLTQLRRLELKETAAFISANELLWLISNCKNLRALSTHRPPGGWVDPAPTLPSLLELEWTGEACREASGEGFEGLVQDRMKHSLEYLHVSHIHNDDPPLGELLPHLKGLWLSEQTTLGPVWDQPHPTLRSLVLHQNSLLSALEDSEQTCATPLEVIVAIDPHRRLENYFAELLVVLERLKSSLRFWVILTDPEKRDVEAMRRSDRFKEMQVMLARRQPPILLSAEAIGTRAVKRWCRCDEW